jgi:antitoxin YefM
MEIINYTDLRSNLRHWLDKVIDDVSELVITRKGKGNLVLVSLDEYNSLKETTYLLKGKNREVLLKSIKELEDGKGEPKELIE